LPVTLSLVNELDSVSSNGTPAWDSARYLREILKAPVYEAAEHTPLQEKPALSARLGNTVEVKREDLQTVHSFKIRGAYNAMRSLSPAERERGVVTASAGNHAQGVARYNQDTGAQVQVKGWDTTTGKGGSFVGNFTDAAKGQAITEQFISQGADIIMPVAGPVGQGTLSSVRQKNDAGGTNAVIWVDSDGYTSSGDGSIIMTSVVKEIGNSVFDTVKNASEGRFSSEPYIGTLKNNGVAAAPFHDFDSRVPAPVKARLEELRGQIIDGSLDVSTPYDPS